MRRGREDVMLQMLLLMRARCHRVARALQEYLDGEVDPTMASAVAEHLEECRRCGLEDSTYLAIKTAIAASGVSQPVKAEPAARARLEEVLPTHGPGSATSGDG